MKLQLILTAILLLSTVVHELGHCIAGWAFGYRVVGLRYFPPGVHLRGPRGAEGIAPPSESLTIALCGPLASAVTSGIIWAAIGPCSATLWAFCGLWELIPVVPGCDGWQIWRAIRG